MPVDILTEEQRRRADTIEKRWARYFIVAQAIFMFVLGAISVFIPNEKFFIKNFIFGMMIFFGGLYVMRFAARLFVRRLSPDERSLIIQADNKDSRQLLNACKINSKNELLRASTEPQDDTLLRAATFTETTPQDQLLRPADSDNP